MINISKYHEVINIFYDLLMNTQESLCSIRLSDDKWTLKEMLGHLIDSASNNHQRIVRLQLEEILIFPGYEPENWKNVQHSNDFDWVKLIILWKNYNELLLHDIKNIKESDLNHYWKKDNETISLEKLIEDYFKHINWHIDLYKERKKEIEQSKGSIMGKYKNINGNSNVKEYEIGSDFIRVKFNDNKIYVYTNESAGSSNIEKMKSLAKQGFGLNTFINTDVKKKYSRKE